jgi:hypothetical protein
MSQVLGRREISLLYCIFGILLMTNDGKNSLSCSLSVPPAELSKGHVITQPGRPNEIIIGAQCMEQWIVMDAMRYPQHERDRFEHQGFVSNMRFGSLKLHVGPR